MAEDQAFDVMIVGAGPAGVSTWLHLKRAAPGLADHTVLIDRAAFPRPKLCGGGLWAWGTEILDGLEVELAIPGLLRSAVAFRFRDRQWLYRSPKPFHMVPRTDFDAALVAAAVARGAVLHEAEHFLSARCMDDGVRVQTSRGRYRVKALVGADGSLSVVRRTLMGAAPCGLGPALQVSTPADRPDDQAPLQIDFSPVAEGLQGYVWHFPGLQDGRPARHHGVVDFRLRRAATRADLPGLLRRALRGRDPALAAGAFARHPIRWFAPDVPIARPGVLLVGDAAGIEPALGGGLHLALAYGALAAGQLQAAFDRGDFTFQDYPAALQADAVGRHIADFSRLAQTIYSGRQNPLDAVRDFFTARLMRRQLAALLRGRA